MLLEIDEAVFEVDDQHAIIGLIDLVATGQHEWRPGLAAADAAERFQARAMPTDTVITELVQKCLVEAANPAPSAGTPVQVSAAELRQLLGELRCPAVYLVEDRLSDGDFLLAVARAFGRHKILVAVKMNWLRLEHAGGAERMERFAAVERGQLRLLGSLRVAALLDSDRQLPRQRTKRHDCADRIRAHGHHVHVWECRHVESYVPPAAWRHHFPDDERKIGMLFDMPFDQRGCLHMKGGLSQKSDQTPEVASHFADLPDDVRKEWQTGFRSPRQPLIPDHLELSEADFAELGESAMVELRQVLAMIERIL